MRICITSQGNNLDAEVDPRFGRCKYFVFVETDTEEFEVFENPNIEAMGGAGIQSGQFMANNKAKSVLTGNVGPNAFETLKAAGIEVITGVSGTIKQAVEQYKKNKLKPVQEPSVGSKFGLPGKERGRG